MSPESDQPEARETRKTPESGKDEERANAALSAALAEDGGGENGEVFPEIRGEARAAEVGPEGRVQLLRDVSLRVRVELGRGKMFLRDILRLTRGSVVELERLAGDPLDIFVNDRLIARGVVIVLDDRFGIRITEVLSPEAAFRVKSEAH